MEKEIKKNGKIFKDRKKINMVENKYSMKVCEFFNRILFSASMNQLERERIVDRSSGDISSLYFWLFIFSPVKVIQNTRAKNSDWKNTWKNLIFSSIFFMISFDLHDTLSHVCKTVLFPVFSICNVIYKVSE